ncbi:MAG: hypothetical protein P4N59_24240 [Negativicutes bacterium]|nr:hypothetical protein [Negativicutes bacterium]
MADGVVVSGRVKRGGKVCRVVQGWAANSSHVRLARYYLEGVSCCGQVGAARGAGHRQRWRLRCQLGNLKWVGEPSTIALGTLGAAGLLALKRLRGVKKNEPAMHR